MCLELPLATQTSGSVGIRGNPEDSILGEQKVIVGRWGEGERVMSWATLGFGTLIFALSPLSSFLSLGTHSSEITHSQGCLAWREFGLLQLLLLRGQVS